MTETEGRYKGSENQFRPCDPFVEAVLAADAKALDELVKRFMQDIFIKEAPYLSNDEIRAAFGPEYLGDPIQQK